MSYKKEDFFCSAMKTAFLIILCLVIFFLGISFIYYSKMDYSNKVSSGFGFLSALGIFATIVVYFLEKNEAEKKQMVIDRFIKRNLVTSLNEVLIAIEDIEKFTNSDLASKYASISCTVKRNKYLTLNALGKNNEFINSKTIATNSTDEMMRESMKNRFMTSMDLMIIVEDVNFTIIELKNIIDRTIISSMKNYNLKDTQKVEILNRFVSSDLILIKQKIYKIYEKIEDIT
ncbi:hypothetical protein AB7W30_04490 [Providencia manganoxydans]|uniref:hypothetical protein n=1 Tax=Providencia manganoxydans TaxID=2923283 RepID=UPI0032DABA57